MIAPKDDLSTLDANEQQFAVELARGTSIAQAAQEVGISEATGYRWAKKIEIRNYVEQVRSAVLQASVNSMCDLTGKAVDTLRKLLDSSDPRVQLAAARQILDGVCKLRELTDIESQILDLRERLDQYQKDKKRSTDP